MSIWDDFWTGVSNIEQGIEGDWNYLVDQATAAAREVAGTIVEASLLKDYFFLKTQDQTFINIDNGERMINLGSSKDQLDSMLKGKAGDAAKGKVDDIRSQSYYNDGIDSISL
ncbi:MAG: hypothetical protein LBI13_10180 [Streptococcaceae bacterium]|jgi:hypothetical protein|nr:hypothetical protein [Streptococcaceae bacterium]